MPKIDLKSESLEEEISGGDYHQELAKVLGMSVQLVDLKIANLDQEIALRRDVYTIYHNFLDNLEQRIDNYIPKIDSIEQLLSEQLDKLRPESQEAKGILIANHHELSSIKSGIFTVLKNKIKSRRDYINEYNWIGAHENRKKQELLNVKNTFSAGPQSNQSLCNFFITNFDKVYALTFLNRITEVKNEILKKVNLFNSQFNKIDLYLKDLQQNIFFNHSVNINYDWYVNNWLVNGTIIIDIYEAMRAANNYGCYFNFKVSDYEVKIIKMEDEKKKIAQNLNFIIDLIKKIENHSGAQKIDYIYQKLIAKISDPKKAEKLKKQYEEYVRSSGKQNEQVKLLETYQNFALSKINEMSVDSLNLNILNKLKEKLEQLLSGKKDKEFLSLSIMGDQAYPSYIGKDDNPPLESELYHFNQFGGDYTIKEVDPFNLIKDDLNELAEEIFEQNKYLYNIDFDYKDSYSFSETYKSSSKDKVIIARPAEGIAGVFVFLNQGESDSDFDYIKDFDYFKGGRLSEDKKTILLGTPLPEENTFVNVTYISPLKTRIVNNFRLPNGSMTKEGIDAYKKIYFGTPPKTNLFEYGSIYLNQFIQSIDSIELAQTIRIILDIVLTNIGGISQIINSSPNIYFSLFNKEHHIEIGEYDTPIGFIFKSKIFSKIIDNVESLHYFTISWFQNNLNSIKNLYLETDRSKMNRGSIVNADRQLYEDILSKLGLEEIIVNKVKELINLTPIQIIKETRNYLKNCKSYIKDKENAARKDQIVKFINDWATNHPQSIFSIFLNKTANNKAIFLEILFNLFEEKIIDFNKLDSLMSKEEDKLIKIILENESFYQDINFFYQEENIIFQQVNKTDPLTSFSKIATISRLIHNKLVYNQVTENFVERKTSPSKTKVTTNYKILKDLQSNIIVTVDGDLSNFNYFGGGSVETDEKTIILGTPLPADNVAITVSYPPMNIFPFINKITYQNVNLKNINLSIVQKYFEIGLKLSKYGNIDQMYYGSAFEKFLNYGGNEEAIESLEKANLIKVGSFKADFYYFIDMFKNNEYINTKNPEIKQKIVTFLASLNSIEDFGSEADIAKLEKEKEEKIPQIYSIDKDFGNYRFKVVDEPRLLLKDLARITDCCQGLGLAGGSCAVDSYVNKYAGVIVLEQKRKNDWEIIAQSYFHYVTQEQDPKGPGIILDNVESQPKLRNSPVLDRLYNQYAQYLKSSNLGIKYVYCGKEYNKLNSGKFSNKSMEEDPRVFHPLKDSDYVDFDHEDFIDLSYLKEGVKDKGDKGEIFKFKFLQAYNVNNLVKCGVLFLECAAMI